MNPLNCTGWAPPVISWFINSHELVRDDYSGIYHKPELIHVNSATYNAT